MKINKNGAVPAIVIVPIIAVAWFAFWINLDKKLNKENNLQKELKIAPEDRLSKQVLYTR